jgi:cysteine dioxygenase type I
MAVPSRWVAPTPLSIRELLDLTGDIAAEVAAGEHEVCFDPARRWHTRLRTGAYVDVWLISWPRHQAAELHDHGGSIGALTVVRGTLTEHRWLPGPGGSGALVPRRLGTGAGAGFPLGYLHDVVNLDPAPALSVHAYSPPLTAMSYYEIDDNNAPRRVRTLLTDDPEPVATPEAVA